MTLSWLSIVRLGLVQMALGAIVVLTTSTLNRLMVVELALPAVLPGFLVALHYGIQITRPNWGFRSDTLGNRTIWIVGGMAILALGGIGAAAGVVVLERAFWPGLGLSVVAYAAIGLGVGTSGTSLLALLATATAPHRRGAAATITWLMMIFGIAVTAGVVGGLLDPYTPARLMVIVSATAATVLVMTALAVRGVERGLVVRPEPEPQPFFAALAEVWRERQARNFTLFVFLSMIAYFMQELILEPYAGLVFAYTPGQSTQLAGAQNGGVFLGMLTVGIMATGFRIGSMRAWVAAGCLGSAAALLTLAAIAPTGPGGPILPAAVALGLFNGMFAVSAIGAMMKLAGEGRGAREGTRMGLWGAAQAIAAGSGGLAGAAAVDVMRRVTADAPAFATVFIVEAALFVAAAIMALVIMEGRAPAPALQPGE
ncbi:PUCC protein [Roseivivax jejudonensis]|uniref:PUCC protein n=1 Tax=Roseivivax jejudonensis TaxID=1529041 RepID=A0A1X6ZQC8_9RHOB|nr:BCD family MFS transporter [Roseivivax jejudonensis]SLN58100.1 PUCC protein [Roseivivax jejudonensis]